MKMNLFQTAVVVKSLITLRHIATAAHHTVTVGKNGFSSEINGINVETISDAEFDVVHNALLRHKIVILRNQSLLSVEGQRQFTKRFGHPHVHLESSSHLPGYKDVNVVSNIKNENGAYIGLFGAHVENFHSDLSWTHLPTKITILKSVIRPDECGDTIFADTHAAYDGLSDEMKERLRGLKGNYCYLKLREIDDTGKSQNLDQSEVQSAANCAVHPLVTTHPITGQKNLYANPSHTASVVGLERTESEVLLQYLFAHTAQEKYAYRHRYEDDDLILWDNRAVHHRATGCPDAFPRKLVRTTVSNDEVPLEDIAVSEPFNLANDRVNAEYVVGNSAVERAAVLGSGEL